VYLHQELTHKIIAAAIEVHKNLGPGLLEGVYRLCLGLELECRGLKYRQEVSLPLLYRDKKIENCFRLDFLVEGEIVLELKSVETILPVHEAQLLTYLRLSGKQLGLLINFNVPILKEGIRRRILSADKHPRAFSLKAVD
jgi:GxxExxY protein